MVNNDHQLFYLTDITKIIILTLRIFTTMTLTRKPAAIIFLFALFLQTIIISYNHLTGFISVTGLFNFLERLLIGTIFSALFGLLTIYLNLKLITLIDKKYKWDYSPVTRFIIEFIAAALIGIFIGTTITITAHIPFPYDNLSYNILNNSLITTVINIIAISILEAIIWFKKNRESVSKAELLEKENVIIQLETLKSQLNPHFLFNSLNTLSALVRKDKDAAEKFLNEFSQVYRYILEVSGKQVIELKEELNFTRSFIYLHQIRFDNAIQTDISIEASKLNALIPPLALQTLIENVLKHNKISVDKPIYITISNSDNVLYIKNNLQPKLSVTPSNGIGLKNLTKRYLLISGIEPSFTVTEKEYIAAIPLIESE
jgi:two-component system, LytTR family, sensor kinase